MSRFSQCHPSYAVAWYISWLGSDVTSKRVRVGPRHLILLGTGGSTTPIAEGVIQEIQDGPHEAVLQLRLEDDLNFW